MADPGGSDGAWGEWRRIPEGVTEPGESGGAWG